MKPEDYIGRSENQVEEFIAVYITPMIEKYRADIGGDVELKV
jgi:hypothetical protein